MTRQGKPTIKQRRPRGQAMVEYSVINWVLVVALVLAAQVRMIPGPRGTMSDGVTPQKNLIELFLEAYQTYYDSYYFVLNLPFP